MRSKLPSKEARGMAPNGAPPEVIGVRQRPVRGPHNAGGAARGRRARDRPYDVEKTRGDNWRE